MADPKSRSDKICLKGTPIQNEAIAQEEIFPGHLVEYRSDGQVEKQDTAQQDCRRSWAMENGWLGESIRTSYKANDRVMIAAMHAGQQVQARVAASATAIVIGDALEAAGDGTVRKLTANGAIIGWALEAIDNSSGSTEVFVNMEVA